MAYIGCILKRDVYSIQIRIQISVSMAIDRL